MWSFSVAGENVRTNYDPADYLEDGDVIAIVEVVYPKKGSKKRMGYYLKQLRYVDSTVDAISAVSGVGRQIQLNGNGPATPEK